MKLLLPLLLLIVAGCSSAKTASEVLPSYVSSTQYTHMSCSSLRAEDLRLRRSAVNLGAAVDKDYKRDKTMEAVGWIIFWPALFAMDGNKEEAAALAQVKGEAEAIRSAMISNRC